MYSPRFHQAVEALIDARSIGERLNGHDAVVLSRPARGGGGNDWFYCRDAAALQEIAERLSPGSVVSFYFDDRLRFRPNEGDAAQELELIIQSDREVVVGRVADDGLLIDVEYLSGPTEVAEFLSQVPIGSSFLCGPFPGRDDDGINAITMTLPDNDGIVRAHPH